MDLSFSVLQLPVRSRTLRGGRASALARDPLSSGSPSVRSRTNGLYLEILKQMQETIAARRSGALSYPQM